MIVPASTLKNLLFSRTYIKVLIRSPNQGRKEQSPEDPGGLLALFLGFSQRVSLLSRVGCRFSLWIGNLLRGLLTTDSGCVQRLVGVPEANVHGHSLPSVSSCGKY